jgi:16S rRNA (guanine966-N2)-methyltransferase
MARTSRTRASSASEKSTPNRLRIIGGRWRAVPITFPSVAGLRPSPDRVRETLFNWLQQSIVGARCLDLFAGSGALGIEALSRGAAHVTFVEREPHVGQHIRETLARLRTQDGEVHIGDALRFLDGVAVPYDIVFLDPPFACDVLQQVVDRLAQGCLASEAYIYLEAPSERPLPALPQGWSLHRSKRAGQVGYYLARATFTAR